MRERRNVEKTNFNRIQLIQLQEEEEVASRRHRHYSEFQC